MFVRFVTPRRITGMQAREGFFCAAYALRAQPGLDPATGQQMATLLAWFTEHLTTPDRFNRSASKGAYRAEFTKGLSWFKPDATEMLAKSHDLIALLVENGHPIDTLRSARIGYVLYEDANQIIAEPYADTPV